MEYSETGIGCCLEARPGHCLPYSRALHSWASLLSSSIANKTCKSPRQLLATPVFGVLSAKKSNYHLYLPVWCLSLHIWNWGLTSKLCVLEAGYSTVLLLERLGCGVLPSEADLAPALYTVFVTPTPTTTTRLPDRAFEAQLSSSPSPFGGVCVVTSESC